MLQTPVRFKPLFLHRRIVGTGRPPVNVTHGMIFYSLVDRNADENMGLALGTLEQIGYRLAELTELL